MKVSSHYKTTIDIDGEPLKLLVKKMNRDQWIDFATEFERIEKVRRGGDLLLERKPGEEDLTDDDVIAKRYMELTPAQRDERLELEKAEAKRSADFGADAISAYVTAEADALFDEDENRYVTEGADIVRLFGQRHDVLSTLLAEIFIQNRLSPEAKKNLLLLRVSRRGSSSSAAAPGATPEPIAGNADGDSSARGEDATASIEANSSGPTGTSN